ncbi:MAG: hypothetical protein IJP15_05775 [Oscillospiraceae bacterium]|nr:hypothetical protein [Oscillospiraceae bacterium]
MTLTEKVAYLKGLVEGLGIDETTSQGKVTKAIVDILDDMAVSILDLEDSTSELYEEVEALDEDLGNLEDDFYDDEDEDDDDCCDCDCCCGDDDDEDFECDEIYEVECPNCHEEICIDGEILDMGSIECPNCGENLTFEIEEECDCGCCDCCCEDHCEHEH